MAKLQTRRIQHWAAGRESLSSRRRAILVALDFRPAFYDCATCTLHLSRHADGRPADAHLIDGLPEEMVVVRADCGRVVAARASLMAGYERGGYFYTAETAWRSAVEWGLAVW